MLESVRRIRSNQQGTDEKVQRGMTGLNYPGFGVLNTRCVVEIGDAVVLGYVLAVVNVVFFIRGLPQWYNHGIEGSENAETRHTQSDTDSLRLFGHCRLLTSLEISEVRNADTQSIH